MKRFRIDFSIRELDVPDEDARRIRFGDDVEAGGIMDFFDRCRDAARALFGPVPDKKHVDLRPIGSQRVISWSADKRKESEEKTTSSPYELKSRINIGRRY